jgi:hypothetical protein
MATDDMEIFRRVVGHLSMMTASRHAESYFTEDTEIYRDLGLYGDDLVELIWWLNKEFGVETNFNLKRYAPRERSFLAELRALQRILGIRPKYERYRSLKIRDIIAAITAKRWPEEAA